MKVLVAIYAEQHVITRRYQKLLDEDFNPSKRFSFIVYTDIVKRGFSCSSGNDEANEISKISIVLSQIILFRYVKSYLLLRSTFLYISYSESVCMERKRKKVKVKVQGFRAKSV